LAKSVSIFSGRSPRSFYGNIRFEFDWRKLIAGKKFYWVEAIPYSTAAYRILITDEKPKLDVERYRPEDDSAPLYYDCGCLLYRDVGTARNAFTTRVTTPNSSVLIRWRGLRVFRRVYRAFPTLSRSEALAFAALPRAAGFPRREQQDLDHAQRLARAIKRSASLELLGPVELAQFASAICSERTLLKTSAIASIWRYSNALSPAGRSISRTRN
jgi:hypothetical protein